jgi:hypothetical protein
VARILESKTRGEGARVTMWRGRPRLRTTRENIALTGNLEIARLKLTTDH